MTRFAGEDLCAAPRNCGEQYAIILGKITLWNRCIWYNVAKRERGRMMKKRALLLLAGLMLLGASAWAQPAEDISRDCLMRAPGVSALGCLTDDDYKTRWASSTGNRARLEIDAPESGRIGGVYLQFYNSPCAFDVQVRDANGEWVTAASCDTDFLTGYAALPQGAQAVCVRPQGNGNRLILAEVRVFAEGEAPSWVQQWQPPLEKADLLVLSAHPDDELLFMGGTIPYYAGERGMDVQVAYLVPATPYRRLELLDGLWLCGVKNYPDLGSFPDRFSTSLKSQYKQEGWSRDRVMRHVTGLLRQYRPDVVVTHDVNGEYGHGAHKVAADAALNAVELAADPEYQHAKLEQTQPWQVQKLYLHLYEEGALRMGWRVPLEAFGGKTAFDVAQEAFACHISQQKTEYRVEDFGPYDNAKFGLAFSVVGPDEDKNDFFEHVDSAKL